MLIIVDPLLRFVRVRDGNDYAEVTRALEPVLTLARETGAHVLAVHHLGKGDREGGDAILDSTAIYAAVDTALLLKRTERYRTLSSRQRYGYDLEEITLCPEPATRTITAGPARADADQTEAARAILDYLRNGETARTVASATVNRELAALSRAFALAVKQKSLSIAPTVEMLQEAAPRQGFLEPADFECVAGHLPGDVEDFARFGYLSGWRKGEVRRLTWPDVDRATGRIVLRREHSKNGEPRVLPLVGDLAALIERRWTAREYRTSGGTTALSPYVFHRAGQPVGDFRKTWGSACEEAGVVGTLFHDLRRSAVRNMDRAGVSQSVAMAISGHKTASVYRRYRIVDEDDLRQALVRMQADLTERTVGTVVPLSEARGSIR